MTYPHYFPSDPPPWPRSPGQPVTHPAGSSPETPLPRAGPARSLPRRWGSNSLCLCFSLSLFLIVSVCLLVAFPPSLPVCLSPCLDHSLCLSWSLPVSLTSPRISAPHCHLMFPFSSLSPLGSIFRHLLVWGEFSGQRWQEPSAEAGGLGVGWVGRVSPLPPWVSGLCPWDGSHEAP